MILTTNLLKKIFLLHVPWREILRGIIILPDNLFSNKWLFYFLFTCVDTQSSGASWCCSSRRDDELFCCFLLIFLVILDIVSSLRDHVCRIYRHISWQTVRYHEQVSTLRMQIAVQILRFCSYWKIWDRIWHWMTAWIARDVWHDNEYSCWLCPSVCDDCGLREYVHRVYIFDLYHKIKIDSIVQSIHYFPTSLIVLKDKPRWWIAE